MNLRQLPIIPTTVVLIAAGIMVWLGFWQLGRADEKAELIAKYEEVIAESEPLEAFPFEPAEFLYRSVVYPCFEVVSWRATAGRNARGQSGYSHIAECRGPYALPRQGGVGEVIVGWSRGPEQQNWSGGDILGVISPGGKFDWQIVANSPVDGLQPLAKPDPRDLPNNHLAYAGQWFFFALTALVIYFLAIRRKLSGRREGE